MADSARPAAQLPLDGSDPTLSRETLFVPDRFELLAQEQVDLRSIVVPVSEALEEIQERSREMAASRRGGLMILKGRSGSGKSTFLDTAGLFLDGVSTVRIPASADITGALNHLPIERFVAPEEFADFREAALARGFTECVSGPMVRSSYRAERALAGDNCGLP